MSYQRMLQKEHKPSSQEILQTIGQPEFWINLLTFMEENYDIPPEWAFYGKKHGWTLRYRKSGRTLLSLFPEEGAFSALIVLGRKEAEKTVEQIDEFSAKTKEIFENTEQLHDGRWVWLRVLSEDQVQDVKTFVQIKRTPKSKR